jgi:hypothetical protein
MTELMLMVHWPNVMELKLIPHCHDRAPELLCKLPDLPGQPQGLNTLIELILLQKN